MRLSLHDAPADAAAADEEWELDERGGLGLGGPLVAMAQPAVRGCASERLPPPHWVACCGGETQYDAAAAARLLRHELATPNRTPTPNPNPTPFPYRYPYP